MQIGVSCIKDKKNLSWWIFFSFPFTFPADKHWLLIISLSSTLGGCVTRSFGGSRSHASGRQVSVSQLSTPSNVFLLSVCCVALFLKYIYHKQRGIMKKQSTKWLKRPKFYKEGHKVKQVVAKLAWANSARYQTSSRLVFVAFEHDICQILHTSMTSEIHRDLPERPYGILPE